jgi:hypothetical protein
MQYLYGSITALALLSCVCFVFTFPIKVIGDPVLAQAAKQYEINPVRIGRTKATFNSKGNSFSGADKRVFIVTQDGRSSIIKRFNATDDFIRIQGFGFFKPQTVRAAMQQDGEDTVILLANSQNVRILNTKPESIPDSCFQLELDRSTLVKTFAEEFDIFSWDSEGQVPEKGDGILRTNYGYGPPTAEASRSLPGEGQVYIDPGFRGTRQTAFGISPFRIENGVLSITGDRAPSEMLPYIWDRKYISGIITTKTHFSQLYGVFEIRARLPKGRGFFPAFWLLPADGTWPPEIDILEMLGHQTTTLYTTPHTTETGGHTAVTTSNTVPDLSTDFHQFAVDWQEGEIRWYFDGVEVSREPTPKDMHKAMYMLVNLGIGSAWPGYPDQTTKFPGVYAVDWIRVYRRAP